MRMRQREIKGMEGEKIDTRKSAVLPKYHSDIGFLVRVGV